MQLPLGLFGVAIGSATLPAISRSAALGRMEEFGDTLRRSLSAVLFLTIPASVGLAVLGHSMVVTVFQWGRFTAADSRATALAMAGYAVGLAGYAAIKVLTPAFYALGDSRTPMLAAIGTVVVNLAIAWALVDVAALGHVALALSTSASALFSSAVLVAVLRRRVASVEGGALAGNVLRILIAAAVMGAACLASSSLLHRWLAAPRVAAAADVALSIPLGVAVFCAAALVMRVPEADMARKAASRARAMLHF
jgi:putative peptidoglycan lipid II flippase